MNIHSTDLDRDFKGLPDDKEFTDFTMVSLLIAAIIAYLITAAIFWALQAMTGFVTEYWI